jgi:hypothetical protein
MIRLEVRPEEEGGELMVSFHYSIIGFNTSKWTLEEEVG